MQLVVTSTAQATQTSSSSLDATTSVKRRLKGRVPRQPGLVGKRSYSLDALPSNSIKALKEIHGTVDYSITTRSVTSPFLNTLSDSRGKRWYFLYASFLLQIPSNGK